MATKQQCENCPGYNSMNGLCTKIWGIPVWDSTNCELFGISHKKTNQSIQENGESQRNDERRKSSLWRFGKPVEIVDTTNPLEYIEQKTRGDNITYKRVFSFYLNYYLGWLLLCAGVLPLLILCFLSSDDPIILFVWLFIALIWGGCWTLQIITSKKHRYDGVFVSQEKLWIAIENRCHEFSLKRITKCDFKFNANLFSLKNKVVFIVETDDRKQYSFDLSSLGINLSDLIKAINHSSNSEIVNVSDVKTKQWKYIFTVISTGILYIIYRLFILKH